MSERIGIVRVSAEMRCQPKKLAKAFERIEFTPFDVEWNMYGNCLNYMGYCPSFELCRANMIPKTYLINIFENDQGHIGATVVPEVSE